MSLKKLTQKSNHSNLDKFQPDFSRPNVWQMHIKWAEDFNYFTISTLVAQST